MRIIRILGEILPVVGMVGLLGLWLYQQTEVDQRSSELRKLAAARSIFQTYQSNNALFNAIHEVHGNNKKAAEQIRVFQIYNYELGLAAIEQALVENDRKDIPQGTSAYDSTEDVQSKMDRTQKRLEKLQTTLAEKEQSISRSADVAKRRYLWYFVGLSLVSIVGAISKLLEKLWAGTT